SVWYTKGFLDFQIDDATRNLILLFLFLENEIALLAKAFSYFYFFLKMLLFASWGVLNPI
ncbi:MAG: hypothetical protein AABX16_04355, partial [Nanoarchaeota archaeon]